MENDLTTIELKLSCSSVGALLACSLVSLRNKPQNAGASDLKEERGPKTHKQKKKGRQLKERREGCQRGPGSGVTRHR